MRSRSSAALSLALALLLASCAGGGRAPSRLSDDVVRIGRPYTIGGRTYTPSDDAYYDAVGYASWYGGESGHVTAKGERFDPEGISAAHKTLPLPSYVEVTALDTGRTILVRINDRGPFAAGRIIDLSHGAARLLGIDRLGTARVRVRRAESSAADRAALLRGKPAARRPDASPRLLAALGARLRPAAIVPPVAPSAIGAGRYVQVAALSDRERAANIAAALNMIGASEVVPTGVLFRVQIGPFASDDEAASALAQAQAHGYQDARIVREPAR